MNKKAQTEIIFVIIQGVILVAIAGALFTYLANIASDNFYEKDLLTKDIALLTNTIFTGQGNTIYRYNLSWTAPDYIYDFKSQKVIIEETVRNRKTLVSFPYADNLLYTTSLDTGKSPKRLFFKTDGYDFFVEQETIEMLKKLKYPEIKTKEDISLKKITFISSKIKDAAGEEKPFVKQVTLIKKPFEQRHLVQDDPAFSDSDSDMLVIFTEGKDLIINIPSNSKTIKQSRKLATLIANSLIDASSELSLIIIPIDSNINPIAVNIQISQELFQKINLEELVAQSIHNYYTK